MSPLINCLHYLMKPLELGAPCDAHFLSLLSLWKCFWTYLWHVHCFYPFLMSSSFLFECNICTATEHTESRKLVSWKSIYLAHNFSLHYIIWLSSNSNFQVIKGLKSDIVDLKKKCKLEIEQSVLHQSTITDTNASTPRTQVMKNLNNNL